MFQSAAATNRPRAIQSGVMPPRLPHAVAELCRSLCKDLFDPYRPERHYMRGPGPKWREKHTAFEQPLDLAA